MSSKVTFKRTKDKSVRKYDVSFSGLTPGEIWSIKNALENHSESGSAVASDVLVYFTNGIRETSDDDIRGIA